MRSNLVRMAALFLFLMIGSGLAWGSDAPEALAARRISTGTTVFQSELQMLPSGEDAVWVVDGITLTDMAGLNSTPACLDIYAFEDLQSVLPDVEAASLCAGIAWTGWTGITLELVAAVAPSLKESFRQAADAGVLRGFLAVALHDKACSEPPADVLAEVERYHQLFGAGRPHSVRLCPQ